MSADMVVRTAVVQDAAAILAIERSCAEAPHWNEAAWAQVFAPHLYLGTQRRCFVAELAGDLIGFIVVSAALAGGVAEMESLAVREDARRHGVGRSLCLQAVFWAQSSGAEEMQLEVRSHNTAARALYSSLGFLEQGIRRGYYTAPAEDAVLMELRLCS